MRCGCYRYSSYQNYLCIWFVANLAVCSHSLCSAMDPYGAWIIILLSMSEPVQLKWWRNEGCCWWQHLISHCLSSHDAFNSGLGWAGRTHLNPWIIEAVHGVCKNALSFPSALPGISSRLSRLLVWHLHMITGTDWAAFWDVLFNSSIFSSYSSALETLASCTVPAGPFIWHTHLN